MREPNIERDFLRFQADGDPAALGRVFDATAAELLKIARHLARGAQDAEDLLQATFVTAIEKAETFDAERRVRPWLVGILVRHARYARRRENRFLEVARLPRTEPADSSAGAESDELRREVDAALRRLPASYREVVEPRVRDQQSGPEIARRVGRSPEVVRVQISRGLARLRGLLPAGLATGLLLSPATRRSLAAVRSRVLAHASGGTFAQTASLSLGAILVANKLFFTATFAAIAVVTAALLWKPGDADTHRTPVALDPGPRVGTFVTDTEPTQRTAPVPSADATATPGEVASSPSDPWQPLLSGVRGRLVSTGEPLAGLTVTLLQLDIDDLAGADASRAFESTRAPLRELDSAVTGADGRFALRGALTRGLYALGVDLGGPRATMRVLPAALAPREQRDLGDVDLGPRVAIRGTVVDEDGDPVSAASVRALAMSLPIAAVGGQMLHPDGLLIKVDSAAARPVPAWFSAWWDRLPFPVAHTDADGRFQLVVARGTVTLLIQRDGLVPATMATATGGRDVREIGEIVLEAGRTLTGRLLSGERPVADARVHAAVRPLLGDATFAGVGVVTDADGRFALPGLPDVGDLLLVYRAQPADGYLVADIGDVEDVDLQIGPRAALTVAVTDHDGATVAGAEVRAVSILGEMTGNGPDTPLETAAGGEVTIDALTPGDYLVTVTRPDHGEVPWRIKVPPSGARLSAQLGAPIAPRVTVVDDATSAAIENARITLRTNPARDEPADVQWTGHDGVAQLGPVSVGANGYAVPSLLVEHPAYAETRVELVTPATEIEVRLRRGGRVEGRLSIAGAPPPHPTIVVLYVDDGFFGFMNDTPWLQTPDTRGDFAFPAVSPGRYRYKVYPSFLDRDLIAAAAAAFDPPEAIASGSCEVRASETTRLDIDAVTEDSAISCRVAGRITLDGTPLAGLRVNVRPSARSRGSRARGGVTDEAGAFELTGIAPGEAQVEVTRYEHTPDALHIDSIYQADWVLAPGAVARLDLDLTLQTLRVRATRPGGEPAAVAQVALRGLDASNNGILASDTTEMDGTATLRLYRPGRYRVDVSSSAYGVAAAEIELPRADPLELTLDSGVPCAGTFTLPASLTPDPDVFLSLAHLVFRYVEDGTERTRDVTIYPPEEREFDIAGLPPGPMKVTVTCDGRESRPIEFALPEAGDRSLHFAFEESRR